MFGSKLFGKSINNLKICIRRSYPSATSIYRRFRFRLVNLPRISYAFSGEDLLLADIALKIASEIRFVDVGCAHPIFDNNTYFLYKKGHKGINVDARAELGKLYKRYRKRDKFLNRVVTNSLTRSTYDFYVNRDDPHTSSVNLDWLNSDSHIQAREIESITLAEVFESSKFFLREGAQSEQNQAYCVVLSVDVEGHDLAVLHSNDWDKYLPDLIAVETLSGTISADSAGSEIKNFLELKGYEIAASTALTTIFTRKR